MKLILSTLVLGTAAASPFTWHGGPTLAVPAAEPIRLVALEPGAQDAEELRRVAAELEAQLADLRAELERTRARAEEARREAEAEHRGEISRVLENGERGRGSIMVLDRDGEGLIELDGGHEFNEFLEVHDDGDFARHMAEMHGADGPAETSWVVAIGDREPRQVVARRWRSAARSEGPGEAHEVHVLRGPGGPLHMEQGLVRHGSGVPTIHITIEKGDLHISADGVHSRARKRKKDAEARPQRNGRKKQDAPGKARKKTKALKRKAASKDTRRKSRASKKTKKRKGDRRKATEKKDAPKKAKGKSRTSKKAKKRKDDPRKAREKKSAPKKAKGKSGASKKAGKEDAPGKANGRFSLFGDTDAEVFLASREVEGTIVIDGERIEFDGDDLPDLRHSDVKNKVIVYSFSKGGDGVPEAFESWLQELIDGDETAGPSADEKGDLGARRNVASPPPAPSSSAR